ncbi:MAG: hypothetical protein SGI71_02970 [Verrucomicrobiota bacterium]|nr:hypothetical protein [Verrucomicrobiota bacterium]
MPKLGPQSRGVHLLEIVLTVTVIALLSAIIIPAYVITKRNSRLHATNEEILELSKAMSRFHATYGRWPATNTGVFTINRTMVDNLSGSPSGDVNLKQIKFFEFKPERIGTSGEYCNFFYNRSSSFDCRYYIAFNQSNQNQIIIPSGTSPFPGPITNPAALAIWMNTNNSLRNPSRIAKSW